MLFYNTNKLRYQSKNNFFSFSSFFLMKIILFSFINITRSRCAKIELTKRKSDPVIIKIQMLHFFLFNLNDYQLFFNKYISSFYRFVSNGYFSQVPLSRGKRIFRAPWFNIFLFAISIVKRNSVLKQSSKTNCIFRVKLVLDRATIADIPITDLLINRIESLRSIKWFPTKTR